MGQTKLRRFEGDWNDKEVSTYLLNLANDMRRAKNILIPLSDLPVSDRREPHSCIIANAFNSGCEVEPGSETITWETEADANTYAKVMGFLVEIKTELVLHDDDYPEDDEYENTYVWTDSEGNHWAELMSPYDTPMTNELVKIANEFDEGELFVEYDAQNTDKYDPDLWFS